MSREIEIGKSSLLLAAQVIWSHCPPSNVHFRYHTQLPDGRIPRSTFLRHLINRLVRRTGGRDLTQFRHVHIVLFDFAFEAYVQHFGAMG